MSDAPDPTQSTNIEIGELLDSIRQRFRARIAELEDVSAMQVSSLELGMKHALEERNEARARCEDLERENAGLRGELHDLKIVVASTDGTSKD